MRVVLVNMKYSIFQVCFFKPPAIKTSSGAYSGQIPAVEVE